MNANSFQLKAAVTDGNEVMPRSTENAYATTPMKQKIQQNLNIFKYNKFITKMICVLTSSTLLNGSLELCYLLFKFPVITTEKPGFKKMKNKGKIYRNVKIFD